MLPDTPYRNFIPAAAYLRQVFMRMKKKILSEIILTILLMLASTVISFAFFQFGNKNIANITAIYSLAVILTAPGTTGYWYGIAASLYCVTAVNYFFSYPYFHFNFSLDGYPITFIGMLAISLLTSTTTSTL